ncbi:MAG: DUF423 domain-containing protein [Kangiellaceae bacterium]|jgi:uncharacterized membrane protein YgdD (TMEM256/DUF423 family)
MLKRILISGGLFAVTSVIIGAFAAHALKNHLSEYALSIIKTGVLYQMFHGIALIICGILFLQFKPFKESQKWLKRAATSFTLGILFFSGSLYGLALTSFKWLGPVTPIGGSLMIAGWLMFIWAIIKLDESSLQ